MSGTEAVVPESPPPSVAGSESLEHAASATATIATTASRRIVNDAVIEWRASLDVARRPG
jgi:hypothetical protein